MKYLSFYEKCAVDKKEKGGTPPLRPIDKNIYYPEGQKGLKLSEQNLFWYTARAEVSTVQYIQLMDLNIILITSCILRRNSPMKL